MVIWKTTSPHGRSENSCWRRVLAELLSILDLLLAQELTEDDSSHLSVLIRDHHQEFVTLYPHASVTPKMHYLIHMPRLTLTP